MASDPVISMGEDVWIGARAVLLGGAHVGNGVIVGAGAVVDFNVPAYAEDQHQRPHARAAFSRPAGRSASAQGAS